MPPGGPKISLNFFFRFQGMFLIIEVDFWSNEFDQGSYPSSTFGTATPRYMTYISNKATVKMVTKRY